MVRETPPAGPPHEPTRTERYHEALRRIAAMKEKHPDAHAAYLLVLVEVGHGVTKKFLETPASKYDDALAVRAHAAVGALESASSILRSPLSFVPKPPKKVEPSVIQRGLDSILRGARAMLPAKTKEKEDA